MLVGFIVAHMLGNLQMFKGQYAVNSYAAKLKSLGPLLWVMRGGLIVAFLLHIGSAIRLVSMNRAARPVKYAKVKSENSSFASRTMIMGGLIVLLFLVFHLLQLTLGVVLPANAALMDSYQRHDVFNMTVLGFQQIPVAVAYLVAMLALCLHLSHGVSSVFQSLGLNHSKYNGILKLAGPGIATLIFVGNCSMPIAVLAGLVKATV